MHVNVGNKKEQQVSVAYEIWPKGEGRQDLNQTIFDRLRSHQDEIQAELDMPLDWGQKKGYGWIRTLRDGDYRVADEQEELVKWFVSTAIKFYEVIPKYDDYPRG